jgi:hypothetical protein
MYKGRYVFSQILVFLSRYEFGKCVKKYNGDFRVRNFFCWDQFLSLLFGQISHRESIRDIVTCLSAHKEKYYHLGFGDGISRSTLLDANEKRDWRIYRDFAMVLITEAKRLYQKKTEEEKELFSEIEGTVYAIDATVIDLCLSLFPWATFRKKKAGIKLHTKLDLRGNIPDFICITPANVHDTQAFDDIPLEAGAFYIMDRAYADTQRLYDIERENAFFIVRLKKSIKWKRVYSDPVSYEEKQKGIRCNQRIRFTGLLSKGGYPKQLRRIKFYDAEQNKYYVFLTNNLDLNPLTIAMLYKERWHIELFFKWIKQHLKIKSFWGRSLNAVSTQIWIAICSYLLVIIIKKRLHIKINIYKILQILSVSLFDKTQLKSLLSESDSQISNTDLQKSLF